MNTELEQAIRKVVDKVDNVVMSLRNIRPLHKNGKTIIDDDGSKKEWEKISSNPVDRYDLRIWEKRRLEEVLATNRKAPFGKLIEDLTLLIWAAFGIDCHRVCVFHREHIEDDDYQGWYNVRVSKCLHWHPKEDRIPIEKISSISEKIYFEGEKNINISDPHNHPYTTDDLRCLIDMAGITSMAYRGILDDWYIVVDTINGKKELTSSDKVFLDDICGMIERIIRYGEEKQTAVEEAEIYVFDFTVSTLSHEIRNPLVTIGGFAGRLSNLIGENPINVERVKQYAETIVKEVTRAEKNLTEASGSISSCPQARLRRADVSAYDLSEIIGQSIRLFEEDENRRGKIKICDTEYSILIKVDRGLVKAGLYRIFKKLHYHNSEAVITIEVEEQDETATILIKQDNIAIGVKKIVDIIGMNGGDNGVVNRCAQGHSSDDLYLWTSLKALSGFSQLSFDMSSEEILLTFNKSSES